MLCKSLKKHASLDVSDPCIRINHFAKPTRDHEKPLVIQGGTDPGGEGAPPPPPKDYIPFLNPLNQGTALIPRLFHSC